MHADNVGVVFDARERALGVVVPRVAIVCGICYGEMPLPFAKIVEGVGKAEGRLVTLVCPIINCMCSGPWPETAVG